MRNKNLFCYYLLLCCSQDDCPLSRKEPSLSAHPSASRHSRFSDSLPHRINRDGAMMKLFVLPSPQGTTVPWLLVALLDLSVLPESASPC